MLPLLLLGRGAITPWDKMIVKWKINFVFPLFRDMIPSATYGYDSFCL